MPKPRARADSRGSPVASVDGGGHRVPVVLDEEAQRQLPGGGEVHRLQDRADVDRAVAEVADGEVGAAVAPGAGFVTGERVPLRPGVAGRHRHAAADDRVGAERPGLQPLQVHGAAAPGAVALGEAEDLGQGAPQYLGHLGGGELSEVERPLGHVGERLGQELVVAAVRAVDGVGRPQRDDRADRAALLSDGGVRGPVHQALAGQLEDGLLEGADEVELAEHGGEQCGVGRLPVRRGAGQAGPLGARGEALDAWHGRHATQRMHTFQLEAGSVRAKSL